MARRDGDRDGESPDRARRRLVKAGIGLAAGATGLAGCVRPCNRGGTGGPGGGYTPGSAGERFYQSGPPSRSGPQINASEYSSLQKAHDDVPEGGTLFLPPGSGPYRDLSISTSHITIASEGDGAWIEEPSGGGGESWALGSSSPIRSSDTSLAQPVSGGGAERDGVSNDVGDATIRVEDASSFSPGDDIFVVEAGRPFGEPRSGGAKGPDATEEFRTVTGVDHENNTLQIHHPMFLPYPLEDRTVVGHVEWTAQDVRVTGLNVRGSGSSDGSHVVEFAGIKNGWFDNLRIEESADDSLALTECYQCRTDGIEMINGGGYGIQIRGSTHTYCTDSVGDGIVNYTVRAGGSAVDVLADGVVGRNYTSSNEGPVCASHWGAFYLVYRDVTVDGEQLTRYRTREMIIEDFDVSGCSTREFVWSQRPFNVLAQNGRIGNYPSDANEKIFHFRLRGDDSPFGNEAGGNIHLRRIDIEQFGDHGPEDIGMFSNGCKIRDLYIEKVTYGGQPLTLSDVQQWDGFDSADIENVVVK